MGKTYKEEQYEVEKNKKIFLEISSVIENAPYIFMNRDFLLKRLYASNCNSCECQSNSGSGSSCGSHSTSGNSRSSHHGFTDIEKEISDLKRDYLIGKCNSYSHCNCSSSSNTSSGSKSKYSDKINTYGSSYAELYSEI